MIIPHHRTQYTNPSAALRLAIQHRAAISIGPVLLAKVGALLDLHF
jgi:hypothetical protein